MRVEKDNFSRPGDSVAELEEVAGWEKDRVYK
jgi:hypothetical protein